MSNVRLLHTADWHLGTRHGPLARFNTEDDQFAGVERVLDLAEAHDADVLLVAGDVFDATPKQLPALTKRLVALLEPRLQAGLHVVLLPGNHDVREHFHMMRRLLALGDAAERLIVATRPEVRLVAGLAIALVPYPSATVLRGYIQDDEAGLARGAKISKQYASMMGHFQDKLAEAEREHDVRGIACAHITVAGVTTPSDHEIGYDADIRIGTSDLPITPRLAYVALGHIHQAQAIGHVEPCHYSGSLDRLDWGEWQDDKSALLVDIPDKGSAHVETLALDATAYHKITVSAADLASLPDRYPGLDRAIVQVTITDAGGADAGALRRQALDLCPRCTNGVEVEVHTDEATPALLVEHPDDVAGTALAYVEEVFGEDPDYDTLRSLTVGLLGDLATA